MTVHNLIFNRTRQHFLKEKARRHFNNNAYFLHREIELILKERVSFLKQKFLRVFISGPTFKKFKQELFSQGHGQDIFVSANSLDRNTKDNLSNNYFCHFLEIDEERLPFHPQSFDLIISFLELQDLNYIPAVLDQNRHLLRSSGLYINAFIGGNSFYELRTSLLQAEIELTQGATPRIHPMIDLETALKIFTQANFKLPVIDRQFFTVHYPSLKAIFKELKLLGARNSLNACTQIPLSRHIIKRAEEIYQNLFSDPGGELCVTIEVIFLTGWR